jgi:hypothetical protein
MTGSDDIHKNYIVKDVKLIRWFNITMGVVNKMGYSKKMSIGLLALLAVVLNAGCQSVVMINTQDINDAVVINASDTKEISDNSVGLEFGDAPDPPYPTLLEHNGARHTFVPGPPANPVAFGYTIENFD